MNFVNPSQTYFRYRLEGADKKWNEIVSDKGQGSVVYNNLLPGEYTFHVMSAGNDHVWSRNPFSSDNSSAILGCRLGFCALLFMPDRGSHFRSEVCVSEK